MAAATPHGGGGVPAEQPGTPQITSRPPKHLAYVIQSQQHDLHRMDRMLMEMNQQVQFQSQQMQTQVQAIAQLQVSLQHQTLLIQQLRREINRSTADAADEWYW